MQANEFWRQEAKNRLQLRLSYKEPLAVFRKTHNQRQGSDFDMHYNLEMGIVLTGRMRRYYEDSHTDLEAGQIWFCGMWEPHGYEVMDVPCDVLLFVAQPQLLTEMHFGRATRFNWLGPFTVPPQMRPHAKGSLRNDIKALAERTIEILDKPGDLDDIWFRILLFEILLTVSKQWEFSPPQQGAALGGSTRITLALEKVFNHNGLVSLAEAAKACSMSRSAFGTHFKSLMGISFGKFTRRYRINGAATDLLNSDGPIKTIAAKWGFTDDSHMHRCFITHYKCSPSEYRKRL